MLDFLTPYGKITLVKSLLIIKTTHVLLSLHSPTNEMIDELDILFKNFIWGNMPPKFRKPILETLPTLGGMKLTNLRVFVHALKLSWLKRIMTIEEGWVEFPEKYGNKKIVKYGDEYPNKMRVNIRKKFWRDVTDACIQLNPTIGYKNALQIHNTPLWYNEKTKLEYKKD